jgi:hypothetical protein
MATATALPDPTTLIPDNISDYGSDFDEESAFDILSQLESQPAAKIKIEDIEDIPFEHEPPAQRIHLRFSRLQQSVASALESSARIESIISKRQVREASVEVEYDESNRGSFSRACNPVYD